MVYFLYEPNYIKKYYINSPINDATIRDLEALGLLTYKPDSFEFPHRNLTFNYYGKKFNIYSSMNRINIGTVSFTKSGLQLINIIYDMVMDKKMGNYHVFLKEHMYNHGCLIEGFL